MTTERTATSTPKVHVKHFYGVAWYGGSRRADRQIIPSQPVLFSVAKRQVKDFMAAFSRYLFLTFLSRVYR